MITSAPHNRAAAKGSFPATRESEGITRFLLVLPMFGGVFLSRFAVNLFQSQLSVSFLFTVLSIVGLAAFGKLRINIPRFILFTLSFAAMIVSAFIAMSHGDSGRVSLTSLLLVGALYLGYAFVADADHRTYAWTVIAFRRICIVIGIAGILQFFGQMILPGPTLFTFRGFIPDDFLFLNYNYVDPVSEFSGLYKSNGYFLPEPSIDGQLMALALIIEIGFFRNAWRILIFSVALLLSYSGTGALLCVLFVPFLLARRGNPVLLLAAICVGIVMLLSLDSTFLEPFTGRVGEFGATQSSAFARFLSPFYLFEDYILPSVRNTLFGLGPGAIEPFFTNFYTEVHDPTWAKVFFEYGLIGTLPFAIFIVSCFFLDTRTRWLSSALFVNYLIFGGYLLSAPWNGIILSLAIWHRATPIPGMPAPRPATGAERREPTLIVPLTPARATPR